MGGVDVWVWFAVLIVAIVVEAMTVELVSLWFAFGAIGAIIAASLSNSLILEFSIFIIVSVLMLIFTRKFFIKLLKKSDLKSNVDTYIGKKFEIDKIEDGGYVYHKINGIDWRVVSSNDEKLEIGKTYEVVAIDGNKLIVKLSDEKNEIKG